MNSAFPHVPPTVRVPLLLFVALAVAILVLTEATAVVEEAAPLRLPLSHRVRREGNVDVDVERNPGEKHRVVVSGQGNVWKDGHRRVDVSGSADNRGGRRAGISYKW